MFFETRAAEKRAVDFVRANKDLDWKIIAGLDRKAGARIYPIEAYKGRLSIVIELEEGTTSKDLKRAIPLALEWRNRLNESQGPEDFFAYDNLLYELELRHRAGESYDELAEWVNNQTGKELALAFESLKKPYDYKVPVELSRYRGWSGTGLVPEGARMLGGLAYAVHMLWDTRYQEDNNPNNGKEKRKRRDQDRNEDIMRVILHAASQWKKKLPLFHAGYPLDGPRIAVTLKAFRQSKEYRTLKVKKEKPRPKRGRSGKN